MARALLSTILEDDEAIMKALGECGIDLSNSKPRAMTDRIRLFLNGEAPAAHSAPDDKDVEWTRDDDATFNTLLLTTVDVSMATIATWTDEQAKLAEEWACAVHFSASDNDDVVVPPRPSFLDEIQL